MYDPNVLAHHGVKGMKWGVIHKRKKNGNVQHAKLSNEVRNAIKAEMHSPGMAKHWKAYDQSISRTFNAKKTMLKWLKDFRTSSPYINSELRKRGAKTIQDDKEYRKELFQGKYNDPAFRKYAKDHGIDSKALYKEYKEASAQTAKIKNEIRNELISKYGDTNRKINSIIDSEIKKNIDERLTGLTDDESTALFRDLFDYWDDEKIMS